MATDVERLIVTLEASTTKYEKALQRAQAQTNSSLNAAEAKIRKFNQAASGIGATLGRGVLSNVSGIATTVGSALTVDTIIQYADSWTNLENKLRAVGVESKDLADVQKTLLDISQRSRSSVADIGDLYSKLALSSKELGASQADVAEVTETVAKALKLGGANAQQTSAAIQQLGQALASGRLQGDELRSLLENAPLLAQKLAKNLGVGVGELKQMGAEGKLLSGDVFRAILQSSQEIDQSFKNTKATFGDFWTILGNDLTRYIDDLQKLFALTEAQKAAQAKTTEQFDAAQAANPIATKEVDATKQKVDELKKSIADAETEIKSRIPQIRTAFMDLAQQADALNVPREEMLAISKDVALAFEGDSEAAATAAAAIAKLASNFPQLGNNANAVNAILKVVAEQLNLVTSETEKLNSTIANAGSAVLQPPKNNFRGATDAQEVAAQDAAKKQYLATLQREASLTREQYNLNRQIAAVKKQAQKDGIVLTEQEAQSIAKLNVAQRESFRGGGGNTLAETFKNMQQDISLMTLESQALSQAYGMLTTSGSAAEAQLKLIQAAMVSGIPVTDQLKAKIEQMAIAYGEAQDKLSAIQSQQQEAVAFQQQLASSFEQAFMSIIDGSGNAADAFKNMAKQILSYIIKMQLQAALFGQQSGGMFGGGGGGGGIFSSLFGGLFGRATGGRVNSGQPYTVGESGREVFVPDRSGRIVPSRAVKGGGSGGAANVKVLNFAGAQVETKTKRGRGGQPEIEILVSEIGKRISEGNFDKQFRSRFGVGPRVVER